MTRSVLAGIDGSPQSEAAALWAAAEAHRRGSALRLLHAWPWLDAGDGSASWSGDLRSKALDAVRELADRIRRDRPGLPVETAMISDDPVDGLVAAAKEQDLLVLGSRGLGGFSRPPGRLGGTRGDGTRHRPHGAGPLRAGACRAARDSGGRPRGAGRSRRG